MNAFEKFSKLVHERFSAMSKNALFITVDGRDVADKYIASFPAGSDPIYKTETEHTCTCCRNFIKNLGNVVFIDGGQLQSVWEIEGLEYPYDVVAAELSEFVTDATITDVFKVPENKYGAKSTNQLLEGGVVKKWNHLHGDVSARHVTNDVAPEQGVYRTSVQLFKKSLQQLDMTSVMTVISMIKDNQLYRGAEHLKSVESFKEALKAYNRMHSCDRDRDTYVWENAGNMAISRFGNTVIASLIEDITKRPDEIASCVGAFEFKVAPSNYKRTTAIITQSMVEDAMKTINKLGLETALERRFANIGDITINNVLWADKSVQSKMKGGIEGLLMKHAKVENKMDDRFLTIDIGIESFMTNVLPTASSIEMLVKGTHKNNFMSLTAPVHGDSKSLFKWDNDFAWSYDGNITDSIKERVKAAGGNVTNAKLRVSLAWFNKDDLDIHVIEPNGNHIYFRNKDDKLDVDMNAGVGHTREPVENVSWKAPRDGIYTVSVNQFSRRETCDVGCVIEIECGGQITQLSYDKGLQGEVEAVKIELRGGQIHRIFPEMGWKSGAASEEKWGVNTETLVKVNTILYSPNYWDGNAVGNKHHFFILEGCKNDQPTRGIYNEFLSGHLEAHRKVLEVLGDKTKCQPTDDQLSGLGFSSTKPDSVTLNVVSGKSRKSYSVKF